MPGDVYRGDVNVRTLQKLLARVDARETSGAHAPRASSADLAAPPPPERVCATLGIHQAFMKAAARVFYKGDWETDRPMIMEKPAGNNNSEVLISTPRRWSAHAHTTAPTFYSSIFYTAENILNSHLLRLSRDVVRCDCSSNQAQATANACAHTRRLRSSSSRRALPISSWGGYAETKQRIVGIYDSLLLAQIVEIHPPRGRRGHLRYNQARRSGVAHAHCTNARLRIAEACRLNAYDGKKSLVRSFPSKVGARRAALQPLAGS